MRVTVYRTVQTIYFSIVTAWKKEATGKLCRHGKFIGRGISNIEDCKRNCESVKGCVGISYSKKPEYAKQCYVCMNDDLIRSSIGNEFYRRNSSTGTINLRKNSL